MELPNVNLFAVLVSGIATMAIGFLWYSPMLLGKRWMKAMDLTMDKLKAKQKEMGPMYALSFVGALVMAYVFGVLKDMTGTKELTTVLQLAFWIWLGFITPVQLTEVIFGGKKKEVYFINTGYQLVSMLAIAVVYSILGYCCSA